MEQGRGPDTLKKPKKRFIFDRRERAAGRLVRVWELAARKAKIESRACGGFE
jgi:hypothetical protein